MHMEVEKELTGTIRRRSVVAGLGYATAGSMLGQWWPAARAQEAVQAQQGQAGGICMTMIFEENVKAKFDSTRYVKNHLPLLRDVYGDSVDRIELRTAVGAETDTRALIATYGGRFAVRASTTFWIRDVTAFGQKLGANNDRINKDLDKIAKGNRLVQLDRIVLALGDARSDVKVDDLLFSLYYLPLTDVADTPTFDQHFFVETYLPKLYSILGAGAVRRLEAAVGMEQGGRKPAQMAGFQVFIRDREAFDAESRRASTEVLQAATRELTQNTMLLITDMNVAGVA